MKIIVDQDACIGAASCAIIAMKTFGVNQEGKVHILNESVSNVKKNEAGEVIETSATDAMDARETIIEGARSCPVFAIKLYEDDGTEINLM